MTYLKDAYKSRLKQKTIPTNSCTQLQNPSSKHACSCMQTIDQTKLPRQKLLKPQKIFINENA